MVKMQTTKIPHVICNGMCCDFLVVSHPKLATRKHYLIFLLQVLGTNAGGTREIVEHNVTGFLHPVGHPGIEVLAQDLQFLLHNPLVREQMGSKGRNKVEKMYLKHHMYQRLAKVFYKCMRIK